MTFCEFCGEQIGYLPFTCKYCGGTFCKKHRLPENHECTFELKHVPMVPTTQRETSRSYQDTVLKKTSREYVDQSPRVFKKYIKRQEKQQRKAMKETQRFPRLTSRFQGTKIIIFLIVAFSITSMIFMYSGIGEYILLSLNAVITRFTYHTFITSLFIDKVDPRNPFFFFSLLITFFMLYFTYMISKIIEMTNGTKFLIKLYLFCGSISILFYIPLRLALALIPDYSIGTTFESIADSVGLAWGGIFGLLSYSIFPAMNRNLTGTMTFIPIRMRGRSFLLILILFRLIPGLLYGLYYSPLNFLFYFPELGGILGSYLVFKYKIFAR
ncbi:MAG: AN1-type zinc finger domain-containing protein [Promethearchaeota archaeon]